MTAAEVNRLVAGAVTIGVELDRTTVGRIDRFLAVLDVWNRRVRLTGERDGATIIDRHVVDSLAAGPDLPADGLVVDIGSGAGFPGIILSCLRPDLDMVLIDSRRRRVSFLREAIREIPLPSARALELRAEFGVEHLDLARR